MAKKNAKKQYHHGDLRASILEASASILAKGGVDALSMREVSRLLQVSHGAPYRHFADKEAILAAIALEGFEELNQEQDSLLSRSDLRGIEKLRLCGSVYIKAAARIPYRFRMMFEQFPPEVVARHQALADSSQRYFLTLKTCVEICQKEGAATTEIPAPQLAATYWAMIHGFLTLALTQGSSLARDSKASLTLLEELCIDTVLKGIAVSRRES
jgi:AcrR family transcriptional regulator